MFVRDKRGLWRFQEAVSGCKPTGVSIDKQKKKKDDTGPLKAKVSRKYLCNIAEEDEEELTETFDQMELDNMSRLFAEVDEVIQQARDQQDETAMEEIKKEFSRFMRELSRTPEEEPDFNERHRLKMETKRRSQKNLGRWRSVCQ